MKVFICETYLELLIGTFTKRFLYEISSSVSDSLPHYLHSFHDSFLFDFKSFCFCFTHMKVSSCWFWLSNPFNMVNFIFISFISTDIICTSYKAYISSISLKWLYFHLHESPDKLLIVDSLHIWSLFSLYSSLMKYKFNFVHVGSPASVVKKMLFSVSRHTVSLVLSMIWTR